MAEWQTWLTASKQASHDISKNTRNRSNSRNPATVVTAVIVTGEAIAVTIAAIVTIAPMAVTTVKQQ